MLLLYCPGSHPGRRRRFCQAAVRRGAERLAPLARPSGDPPSRPPPTSPTLSLPGRGPAGGEIMSLFFAWSLFMLLAGPAQPASPPWLLDDFESPEHLAANELAWITLGDDQFGGASTLTLEPVAGGAHGSAHALRLRGSLAASGPAFIGAWAPLDGQGRPVDLGGFEALRFFARGEGKFQAGMRSGARSGMANFMAPF